MESTTRGQQQQRPLKRKTSTDSSGSFSDVCITLSFYNLFLHVFQLCLVLHDCAFFFPVLIIPSDSIILNQPPEKKRLVVVKEFYNIYMEMDPAIRQSFGELSTAMNHDDLIFMMMAQARSTQEGIISFQTIQSLIIKKNCHFLTHSTLTLF